MFFDKCEIRKIVKKHDNERHVITLTTYNHLVVILFVLFEGYGSIRKVILMLHENAHRLAHFRLLGEAQHFFRGK